MCLFIYFLIISAPLNYFLWSSFKVLHFFYFNVFELLLYIYIYIYIYIERERERERDKNKSYGRIGEKLSPSFVFFIASPPILLLFVITHKITEGIFQQYTVFLTGLLHPLLYSEYSWDSNTPLWPLLGLTGGQIGPIPSIVWSC